MSDDPINAAGLALIKRNEGCRLLAYQDSVGIWTIGYGHTPSHKGERIDQAEAVGLLMGDLHRFEQGVADLLEDAPTGDNQYAAMICLAYNIGLGAFGKSSILRFHKAGRFADAANAFRLYNKAGGKRYPGLVRRREEERALYLKDDADV